MNKKQSVGFSLIELMVAVAIAGVLASMAVPAFEKMVEGNRLKEAAESLKSNLMWMRTETIKRSCNLQVAFNTSAWSYTIFRTDGTCDCPAGSNCNDKVVSGSQFTGISMSSASTPLFDFRRGTALSGYACFSSSDYKVRVKVSPSGRVTVCTNTGSEALSGYTSCPSSQQC